MKFEIYERDIENSEVFVFKATAKLVWKCLEKLWKLADVELLWVPAYHRIEGNEKAY